MKWTSDRIRYIELFLAYCHCKWRRSLLTGQQHLNNGYYQNCIGIDTTYYRYNAFAIEVSSGYWDIFSSKLKNFILIYDFQTKTNPLYIIRTFLRWRLSRNNTQLIRRLNNNIYILVFAFPTDIRVLNQTNRHLKFRPRPTYVRCRSVSGRAKNCWMVFGCGKQWWYFYVNKYSGRNKRFNFFKKNIIEIKEFFFFLL